MKKKTKAKTTKWRIFTKENARSVKTIKHDHSQKKLNIICI